MLKKCSSACQEHFTLTLASGNSVGEAVIVVESSAHRFTDIYFEEDLAAAKLMYKHADI